MSRADVEKCWHCDKLDRYAPVQPEDRFCALCGQPMRILHVGLGRGDDVVDSGGVRDWLVTEAPEGRSTTLFLKNTGTFPLTLSAIEVTGPARSSLTLPLRLEPHADDPVPCEVTLLPEASGPWSEVHLTLQGDFGGAWEMWLRPVAAVQTMVATAPWYDVWSRLASGTQTPAEGTELKPDREVDKDEGRLRWICGPVTLLPWRSRITSFVVRPLGPGWEEFLAAIRVDANSLRCTRSAKEVADHGAGAIRVDPNSRRCTDERITAEFKPENRESPRVELTRVELTLAGMPQDDSSWETEITFELEAVGRPQVCIPVALRAGRPEWQLVEPQEQTALVIPVGCESEINLVFKKVGHETCVVRHHRVRVWCGVEEVPTQSWLPEDSRHGSLATALTYTVFLNPKDCQRVPMRVTLEAEIEIEVGSGIWGWVPLSAEATLDLVVEPAAEPTMDLVIDFGTTNTCVAVIRDTRPTEGRRIGLGPLAAPGARDAIPTVIWIDTHSDRTHPFCLIGLPALLRSKGGDGVAVPQQTDQGKLIQDFKTKIGSGRVYELVSGPGHRRVQYTPADLAGLFLSRLVRQVRCQMGQNTFGDCRVTYPTAFSIKQREEFRESLEQYLKPCGIARTIKLSIDEANAGAFSDLDRYLRHPVENAPRVTYAMIMDCGGGTTDVAVLSAERRAPTHATQADFHVVPRGITGLRDFGGNKITGIIADAIGKKLATHLLGEGGMDLTKAGWIPLPVRFTPRMSSFAHSHEILQIADLNAEFVWHLAEQVKVKRYGGLGEFVNPEGVVGVPNGTEWYSRLPREIMLTDDIDVDHVCQDYGGLWEVKDIRTNGRAEVPGDKLKAMLRHITLQREEIDEEIEPILKEVFGRAKRLWWHEVMGDEEYRPPDLFIFAGGSSLLPILWKLARSQDPEWGLGIRQENTVFYAQSAKHKVVHGASLYHYDDCRPNIFIKLADPHARVLVPVVYGQAGGTYATVFKLGYEIKAQEEIQPTDKVTVDYQYWEGIMKLVLHENFDYRSEGEPDTHLEESAKEVLAKFQVKVGPSGLPPVKHWIEQRKDGERWLMISYNGEKPEGRRIR